jgi:predicted transcriptional regulator
MYACNLSWNTIKDTLERLEAEGCIEKMKDNSKQKRYCITAKGRDIIGYSAGLKELI